MTVTGINPAGVRLIVGTLVPVPFATLAVALRFVSRRKCGGVGSDDWSTLAALFLYYSLCVTNVLAAGVGKIGFDRDNVSETQHEDYLKILFCIEIVAVLASLATKISVLLMYRRIFIQKLFKIATTAMGAIVVVWGVAVVLTRLFGCYPIDSYWHPYERSHCINTVKFVIVSCVSSLFLDLVILGLPIPGLWKLQMSTKKKFILTGIFLVGLLACIVGFLGVASFWLVPSNRASDTDIDVLGIWLASEVGLAIICSSALTLSPLFQHWQKCLIRRWSQSDSRMLRSLAQTLRNVSRDRYKSDEPVPAYKLERSNSWA